MTWGMSVNGPGSCLRLRVRGPVKGRLGSVASEVEDFEDVFLPLLRRPSTVGAAARPPLFFFVLGPADWRVLPLPEGATTAGSISSSSSTSDNAKCTKAVSWT